ncbi:MAG: type IV-A pilus assembly ATPase PilB [Pseudomonadota bacterium]|nr:type IV-A pilus assembly ATPase PilB [Pseudomonadota bacterium]
MNQTHPNLRGLPKRLVLDGLIKEADALEMVDACVKQHISVVDYLLEQNLIEPALVARVASNEFGLPIYDLRAHNWDSFPKGVLNEGSMRKHQALPLLKKGNRLILAVSDPTNQHALTEIRFQSGLTVEPILVAHDQLLEGIEQIVNKQGRDFDEALGNMGDVDLGDLSTGEAEEQESDLEGDADDAPVVRFINKMLLEAIKKGASDIHFEPYEKYYRVRFRTDGILEEISRPPPSVAPRLAARLKVMSRMDISERRVPQDGRIKLKITKTKAIDFRVNTLPTLYGEKIVLRILDSSQAKMGIDALGYEEDQKDAYLQTLNQSQGMILVTGPTGSGKTVSLYTGLGILNTAERNISTAEDPVEINMEGINQVQINNRTKFTFAEALRAFLRQDPDVIMVGEIRDLETAEIAIKAAQTGHLVLSTLHTNSAPETLTRLLNMGVPAFNVATSVSLIIAQRLARRLCNNCKKPYEGIPDKILEEEGFGAIGVPRGEITLYHPVGCKQCTNGYKGRVGIYEVLRVTPTVSRLIMEGGNSIDIAEQAKKEGFRTLRQSALRKVASGAISLEEANRVTKD